MRNEVDGLGVESGVLGRGCTAQVVFFYVIRRYRQNLILGSLY